MDFKDYLSIIQKYTSEPVKPSSLLLSDLSINSFVMMEIICDLEEQGVEINFTNICMINTVEEFYKMIMAG